MQRAGFVLIAILLLLAGGSGARMQGAARSGVWPTPPDGSIHTLERYAETERANYYRLVYWSDGLRIAGFYAEPKAPGKYPAVIYNRGGNREVGALRGDELAPFAESGFVAVASQYRGGVDSEGRDELGGADVHDVINLIPLLKSRKQVDPDRIAMFGSSRGALMTCLTLRLQTERGVQDIKVAAITSGLVDLILWAQERPDLDGGVYPELVGATTRSDPEAFRQRSATYWPEMIQVPLLIQHGDADMGVSVEQSRLLYWRLRAAGRTARLVVLPGGDHGLSNYEAGMPETMQWFQRYLAQGSENFDYALHREAIERAYQVLRPG